VIGNSKPKHKRLVVQDSNEEDDDTSSASSQSTQKITNAPTNAAEEFNSEDASLTSNTVTTASFEDFPPLPDSPIKPTQHDPAMLTRADQTLVTGTPTRADQMLATGLLRNQNQSSMVEEQMPIAKGATPKDNRQEANVTLTDMESRAPTTNASHTQPQHKETIHYYREECQNE
jgi:hypothetical protein